MKTTPAISAASFVLRGIAGYYRPILPHRSRSLYEAVQTVVRRLCDGVHNPSIIVFLPRKENKGQSHQEWPVHLVSFLRHSGFIK